MVQENDGVQVGVIHFGNSGLNKDAWIGEASKTHVVTDMGDFAELRLIPKKS